MPRTSRITWLNHPHLVVAHANGGAKLFIDDADYHFYIDMLRQMARDRILKVFAYCLMEHELRLVIEPKKLVLSRIMQRLHGRHTARVNGRQNRMGHLFRGRFRSLVFLEHELIDVVRSVHLWPVRQGILRRPELYPFSSHASYAEKSNPADDFLQNKQVLSRFSGDQEAKRRAFVRYCELVALEPDNFGIDEIEPGIGGNGESAHMLVLKAQGALRLGPKKSSVKLLAERASLLLSISQEQLVGPARRQDLVMARRLLATAAVLGAGRSVTEVAGYMRRNKAQVSRLVAQGMDLLESNEAFILMFESLKAKGAFPPT